MNERFKLQVLDGSWRTVLSGQHTAWMEDEVSGRLNPPTMKYRCFDEVTSCVVSEWDPEARTWTENPDPWTSVETSEQEATVRQTLEDEVTGTSIAVQVSCKPGGITLKADDHGDKCTDPGDGEVVFIEFRDGKVWVRVWADVNQEDPTHSICLEGARESFRDARPMFVQNSKPTCDGGTYTTFEPFLVKPGDRVLVTDPDDPSDRYEAEVVEMLPQQEGFNPPMVYVRDASGDEEGVAIALVEVIRSE